MEEVDLAGEVFDDGEKVSDAELKPDTKALESLNSKGGGRPEMQGGPEGKGAQGRQGAGIPNREAMMKRLDTDGDGKISDAERSAAMKQFQQMQGSGGAGGGRGGRGGGGGAGGGGRGNR